LEYRNIKAIIFDFDGTLIKSNHIKYNAWFDVFIPDQALSVALEIVLEKHLELSRFIIIRKVLEEVYGVLPPGEETEAQISHYADRYNDLVFDAAKKCAELPGASALLERLALQFPLYCSSNTPESDLQELIEYRGWSSCFAGIYGYPRTKKETIASIVEAERISGQEILVVGDGTSDRESAVSVGAYFHHIAFDEDLEKVVEHL
jgi:phosphoglycolate phosphatase-like HAD superfamily hydrolase